MLSHAFMPTSMKQCEAAKYDQAQRGRFRNLGDAKPEVAVLLDRRVGREVVTANRRMQAADAGEGGATGAVI